MQNILAIFVGIFTFLAALALKKFIKWKKHEKLKEVQHRKNRIRNVGNMLVSFAASIFMYYVMCRLAGIHCKLCCAYKAWAIALALYAVYKQFFLIEYQPV